MTEFFEREYCNICNKALPEELATAVMYRGQQRPFMCAECQIAEHVNLTEERVPKGYKEVVGKVQTVYYTDYHIVVLGQPEEDSEHSCDAMGCGSFDHVLFRANINTEKNIIKEKMTEQEIIEEVFRRR